jgi:hypothetical protein
MFSPDQINNIHQCLGKHATGLTSVLIGKVCFVNTSYLQDNFVQQPLWKNEFIIQSFSINNTKRLFQ